MGIKDSSKPPSKPTVCWRGRHTDIASGASWVRFEHQGKEMPTLRVNQPGELVALAKALADCCQAFIDDENYFSKWLPCAAGTMQVSYEPERGMLPVYIHHQRGDLTGRSGLHRLEIDIAFDLQRWLTQILGLRDVRHAGNCCNFGPVKHDGSSIITEIKSRYTGGDYILFTQEGDQLINQLLTAANTVDNTWVATSLVKAGPAAYVFSCPTPLGEEQITCSRSTLVLLACAIYESSRQAEQPDVS